MNPLDLPSTLLWAAVVLLAVSTTISLMIRKRPSGAHVLVGTLSVSFLALLGLVLVDLFGVVPPVVVTEQARALSLVAATHRRLLVILPVLLTGTSSVILSVYRERIAEAHAKEYRNAVSFSAGFSLIAVILIAIESMA